MGRCRVEFGIKRAPAAFIKRFTGENTGKMLVKLNRGDP
jgi:NADPH-dependent curcumin reductase CurA